MIILKRVTLKRIALLIIGFWSLNSFCEIPQRENMRQSIKDFQSHIFDFAQVRDDAAKIPGTYPKWMLSFYNWIGWSPLDNLESFKDEPGECSLEHLQNLLAQKTKSLQGFISKCGPQYENEKASRWSMAIKGLTLRYEPNKHPLISPIQIHLPGGGTLGGIFAYRDSKIPRPLVIIRLGIMGGARDFQAEKYLLWQLFDESVFNVLVLDNTVSSEYIGKNTRLTVGGYDEGLQNFWIAKKLQDSSEPISKIIDSVHLIGVSLGGHGVLFASELNELNPASEKQKKVISSFIGLCPVINLEYNFKNLTTLNMKNFFVDYWSAYRLQAAESKLDSFKEVSFFSKIFPYYLKTAVDGILKKYIKPSQLLNEIQIPDALKNENDFWKLNQFWQFPERQNSEVLVIANSDDLLVPVDKNIGDASNGINVEKVIFPLGFHCTTQASYRWNLTGNILRSYILASVTNGDFKKNQKIISREAEIPSELINVYRNLKNPHYQVLWTLYQNPVLFFTNGLQIDLKLEDIDFPITSGKLNKEEQLMRERWLRSQLKFSVIERMGKTYLVASIVKVEK